MEFAMRENQTLDLERPRHAARVQDLAREIKHPIRKLIAVFRRAKDAGWHGHSGRILPD